MKRKISNVKFQMSNDARADARRFGIILGVLTVVAVLVAATVFSWQQVESANATRLQAAKVAAQKKLRREIDGVLVPDAARTPRLLAVMLDNMPDAYPLVGLHDAVLVYEAPVEGGTTRLLAFYPEDAKTSEIGPVRSLRPYFIDFAREVGATPVHVGGSPEALARVSNENIMTLNQFFDFDFFWRSAQRARPHNVMTSSDLFRQALDAREVGPVPFASWTYRTKKSLAGTYAAKIKIPSFGSEWQYDKKGNFYAWKKTGATAKEIRAANVVVMHTEIKTTDGVGRRAIKTIGSGKAIIFSGGKKIVGKWSRGSLGARTQFLDAKGKPVPLAAGTTWIEVVPTEATIQ